MSYYVDPCTNIPQYPLYPVYGYHSSTVARQVGALGTQGSTTMPSSFVDNNVNTSFSQALPTSTMLVWTQVGEIVFPVYTTMPISTGPPMTGNENAVTMNQSNSMSKNPPVETENGLLTTSKLGKDSDAVKPCPFDINHGPTKMTSEATRSWCPIHKTKKHILQDCWVFINVRAEIRACKERGIQRTSPTRDVYCPIHKTKNHDLSSYKVLLGAMKTPSPKSYVPVRDNGKEQGATPASHRFVGVIDIDPREPSVLHLLEDYGSSTTSAPRDVLAIDDVGTSAQANAEAANQSTTLAQHIRAVQAILRETPYNPVLNDDLERWTERLRESVTNLSNAFEEAATAAHQDQPPIGDANDRHPRRSRDRRQPTAPNVGCRAFGRSLRDVRWPERFRPGAIEKYDGSTDPEKFLQIYSTVLYAAGVDDNALANYLPTALKGSARSWPMHLPPYSISSWADLWQQFVANFQGTYKRHAIEDDLHALTQNSGESLRGYVRRFNECRNTIPEITDASVIRAFKFGVRDRYTTQELATRRITTTRRLFEIVERCAHVDDALRRKNDKPKTGGEKKQAADASESSKKKNRKNGKRKAQAEVLAAEYVNPPKRPDPQGSDTKKSYSINLLFASTLDAMGIPQSELTPTDQPFHGITPQSSSRPLGKITLPVTFDQVNNFRTEQITFDVAEFDTAYNAIIGRTALAKFMTASHYAYQVLKMPGPKGTITIQGNAKRAVQCDKRSLDMVEQTPSPPATTEPPKKLSDMPGVPREVIEHKLMVRPDAKPVKQRLRRFAPDRKQAIREELDKLLKAGFIREVLHPEWLANPVMVRKTNGKRRMCVDFTDLNKACPKYHFPLPRIDQLVDSTAGCELLSFLDAYSGYHQISMAKEDEEKTAFITPFGGALSNQLGNNVEAYVDDIVVKTKTSDSLIDDLRETFDNLRRYRLMLNPEKCTFGVPSGKLLGFLVSGRGIEANPEKIKAIENMKSPTRLKEPSNPRSQEVREEVQWNRGPTRLSQGQRRARREPLKPRTFLDILTKPSVKEVSGEVGPNTPDISSEVTEAERAVADIETIDDWRIPLIKFISSEELPEDDTEAEKITRKAKIYCMVGNDLYKKAPNGRCEACQFHSKHTKLPAQALQTIPLTWPFSCWGLDILGPFPRGQGGYRFLFVAIDKFTKWIEAVPTGEIKADNAIKFIRGIFCRYGLSHRIITDNGSQFISADFQDYCIGLGVKICFASVSHPQSNGQVERANDIVLQGIKTRVYDRLMSHDKKWVEELPSVLWAVRTTPTTSNKETPFFLVYGSEAMLPGELRHQSTRVQKYSDENQEEQRDIDVNLLKEHRERVAVRAASYQQALRRYHEKRIRARILSIGDYVLRRVQTQAGRNKLSPKWEGPYTITQVLRPGAFKIADGDGRELANSWNIDQLCKFYV
uniref:Retrotransposon protein, putative, unclassified n=1 Tax=Oryza sativa subsp. japonica TaxID=39947 RepID=Q2QVR6_ORYSJ|nr:retrotransposon protein, putative, unclassified [Oryza sativa Japonica Group]